MHNSGDDKGSNKKSAIIRLILSFVGILISGFFYLVLDLRFPAGVLLVIIIFINYLEAKKEYEAELKKIKATNKSNLDR